MDPDLLDAVTAWQGGELPPGRGDALLARLEQDAEFRAAFSQEIWMLSLMRVAQAPEPRWLELCEKLGISHESAPDSQRTLENSVMTAVSKQPFRLVQSWWRLAAFGAASVAAVLCFMLLRKNPAGSNPEPPPLAQVLLVDAPQWTSARQLQPGDLLKKERVQLQSGRATLLLNKGVLLTIEGPADLELIEFNQVVVHRGKIRTSVPMGAEGFCVETPRGTATDLGTEMGVSVADDGSTQVGVFKGSVLAALKQPEQDGVRTQVLKPSEAVRMLPSTGEFRPSGMTDFPAAPEIPLPPLPLTDDYSKAILAAQPRHYWRLNRSSPEGLVPNEITGGMALQSMGPLPLRPDERGHISARLGYEGGPSGFMAEQPWTMKRSGSAVEMWFATTDCGHATLASLAPDAGSSRQFSLLEFATQYPDFVVPAGRQEMSSLSSPAGSLAPGRMRYLMRAKATSTEGVNLISHPGTLPFVWHHVVAQRQEREMALYVDGVRLASGVCDEVAPESTVALLFGYSVGYTTTEAESKPWRQLHGRLAEIAVYDRMLTPEEIRQHATLGGKKP
ncbi:LamG-like jellyroll fold domain-containing protein [Haloferula sp. BvORR071]|uniref:LamG-like jellyroll fold domain-containing protein n=1 Tax=Haloferula sp. BvORR071 TaxID=1396141 RepID=UPI00054F6FB1|nr:LamG-like jellyroll fold domain-containing protein [Haloferula sp. BvORR071]